MRSNDGVRWRMSPAKRAIAVGATAVLAAAVAAVAIVLLLHKTQDEPAQPPAPAAAAGGAEAAFSLLEVPRALPELVFLDGEGRKTTLKAFAGRMVLLNLWATWCAPCREEMPALERLQALMGGTELQVVPLSIDRAGARAVAEFFREIGIERLPIYVDPSGEAARRLRAFGLPTTLLIDPRGREMGRLVGPAEWDAPAMIEFLEGHLKKAGETGLGP